MTKFCIFVFVCIMNRYEKTKLTQGPSETSVKSPVKKRVLKRFTSNNSGGKYFSLHNYTNIRRYIKQKYNVDNDHQILFFIT